MRIVLLVALVGCTSDLEAPATDAEVHQLEPCSDRWSVDVMPFTPGVTQCEAACADELYVQQHALVDACYVDASSRFLGSGRAPGEQECGQGLGFSVEWNGRRGCCLPDSAPVTFIPCKP